MDQPIVIRGAREHNLKNVSCTLPRNKLIVFTGLSGSGKSTLAFDTIYAEGQRRYVESLSAYARQFIGLMEKPDVDSIEGLSPSISIDQKGVSANPRSTVGTVTEIYDYFRLLFARIGIPYCPKDGTKIQAQSPGKIAEKISSDFKESPTVTVLSPIVRQRKGTYEHIFSELLKEGFSRVRVDGKVHRLEDAQKLRLEKYKKHDIEVVVARVSPKDSQTLAQAIETAVKKGEDGLVYVLDEKGAPSQFSSKMACPACGLSFEELEPRMFSFNSPFGACEACNGLGIKMEFDPDLIVPDRKKSIADGAVAIYRNAVDGWRAQYLGAVARHFGFSILTPIEKLSKKQESALFYGSGEEKIRFEMRMNEGESMWAGSRTWEGILPQCERLYRETKSEYRRTEFEKYMRIFPCPSCKGKRLKEKVLSVKIHGKSIDAVSSLSISSCLEFFSSLPLSEKDAEISRQILKEILARLTFLDKVGLSYLTVSRSSGTLSGGEAQRIRLATQIGSNLTGVLYVLDEPSIGLHQRDNAKLLSTLKRLRDLGNTVIVVEHDEETILEADHVLDLGPGAGIGGGEIVAQGTPLEIAKSRKSLTGQYLSGKLKMPVPEKRRSPNGEIILKGCSENNLKGFTVSLPLKVLVSITGVSGSGKSTFVYDTLYKALMAKIFGSKETPGKFAGIEIKGELDKVVVIDQSPIGRTPRSNPATYTKVFDEIRALFSQTEDARSRGYSPGRFSFNVPGGRCDSCEGDGVLRIEMNFLPDVYVNCEECKGKRYNSETLSVKYAGKSISDVLEMTVDEAHGFFSKIPALESKLSTLRKVGLGYIKLGQSATTLSGGEAQRIKITRELSKRDTGRTVYLLDEPTTGLHFHDVKMLISVLNELVDKGNSVVVIEHNLDVIKSSDWIIDLGPEGGDAGGEIVAQGTPEAVSAEKKSATGKYLRKALVS